MMSTTFSGAYTSPPIDNKYIHSFMKNLSTFSGSAEEDLEDWLAEMDEVRRMANWPDSTAVLVYTTKLSNDIRATIRTTLARTSLQELCSYLHALFPSVNGPSNAIAALSTLKIRPTETPELLALRVTRLCAKAGHLTEAAKVNYFVSALEPRVLNKLSVWPSTLAEAVMAVTGAERVLALQQHQAAIVASVIPAPPVAPTPAVAPIAAVSPALTHKVPPRAPPRATPAPATLPSRPLAYRREIAPGVVEIAVIGREGQSLIYYHIDGKPVCAWCHAPGHVARDCAVHTAKQPRAQCSSCSSTAHPTRACHPTSTTTPTPPPVSSSQNSAGIFVASHPPPSPLSHNATSIFALGWSTATEEECEIASINAFNMSYVSQPATVRGRIEGHYSKIMLDTGAATSVISATFLRSVAPSRLYSLDHYEGPSLVGASGDSLNILGRTLIKCTIENTVFIVQAVVAEGLPYCMLWGMDALYEHHVRFNNRERIAKFTGGLRVPYTVHQGSVPVGCAKNDITIPAECGTIIQVATPSSELISRTWVAEPLYVSPTLVIASTLVNDPKCSGSIPIQVLNLSTSPITIKTAQPLVRLSSITSISAFDTDPEDEAVNVEIAKIISGTKLSEDRREQLRLLLERHKPIFREPQQYGASKVPPHHIRTTSDRPVATRSRRYSQAEHEEIDRQVDTMLTKGAVGPSTSPWAAPIVLARKKDGTWRFCVDYRGLNNITPRDVYPLPRIDDALDALAGAKYFSTLDAWAGYWQVGVAEEDQAKTAFATRRGLFEYKVMPFGLVNAPASFQRAMNLILHGLTWRTCLVYLDDIIVFSATFEEHLSRLDEVLSRLAAANIRIKLSKCQFCADTVNYLGHVVSSGGVSPDPKKVE